MAIIKDLYDNKWIGLYEEDNIKLFCKIATYKSEFLNISYDIITGITILKDNKVIYQRNNIHMAYNEKKYISISNYVEKIACYIKHTEDDPYWINKFLDKLFIDLNTINIEIYYRNKTREIEEKKRIEESNKEEEIVSKLKKDIQEAYNNKGYAATYGLFDIYIIDKKHSTNEIIKNQNNYFDTFHERNMRDDKSEVRNQFLYKHITTNHRGYETIIQLQNILQELTA